jgi:hypothetical protein
MGGSVQASLDTKVERKISILSGNRTLIVASSPVAWSLRWLSHDGPKKERSNNLYMQIHIYIILLYNDLLKIYILTKVFFFFFNLKIRLRQHCHYQEWTEFTPQNYGVHYISW